MSQDASAVPSASRRLRDPQWSKLRHQESSASSPERSLSIKSTMSPRSTSTHSTVKDTSAHNRERYCSITVNDGYSKDEVLLNFDRLGNDAKTDALMAITATKSESSKGPYGSLSKAPAPDPRLAPGFSLLDQDYISSRYVFFAKDMPKEMKARYPEADVCVAKHIADAFGMKKGSQVVLALVGLLGRDRLWH
jgi:hypothetical protein